MHKVNELSHDFLQSWISAWTDYILFPKEDSQPIYEMAQECARIARVDLDEETGFIRVLAALGSIARYCSQSKEWRDKNLFKINQCLQTIMQEMMADKKTRTEAINAQTEAGRVFEHGKTERGKAEKEMKEETIRLKQEHEKNWTAEEEASYQAYMRKIELGRVISIDLAKEKHINKAL
jgi:hypothetical protein